MRPVRRDRWAHGNTEQSQNAREDCAFTLRFEGIALSGGAQPLPDRRIASQEAAPNYDGAEV